LSDDQLMKYYNVFQGRKMSRIHRIVDHIYEAAFPDIPSFLDASNCRKMPLCHVSVSGVSTLFGAAAIQGRYRKGRWANVATFCQSVGIQRSIESLSQVEAVRLFLDRARLSRSDFVLQEHNADVVAALCRRLDGIPLALELAAARLRSLSVEDILARLEGQFALRAAGERAVMPRH